MVETWLGGCAYIASSCVLVGLQPQEAPRWHLEYQGVDDGALHSRYTWTGGKQHIYTPFPATPATDVQFYMECAQIIVVGGSGAKAPQTHAIPGIYSVSRGRET